MIKTKNKEKSNNNNKMSPFRMPSTQVRVYSEEGIFVKRFGHQILQHPRGIAVDKMGRVVVVECKVGGDGCCVDEWVDGWVYGWMGG